MTGWLAGCCIDRKAWKQQIKSHSIDTLIVLYVSSRNESGANKNNESEKAVVKTKEYVWHQNKDYMGKTTC